MNCFQDFRDYPKLTSTKNIYTSSVALFQMWIDINNPVNNRVYTT